MSGEPRAQRVQRVRRVLTEKRSVVNDSTRVVRSALRSLGRDRLMVRLIPIVIVALVAGLLVARGVTSAVVDDPKRWRKPTVTGVRFLITMALQFVVAAWLYARWLGREREPVKRLFRRVARRLPSLLVAAAALAWFEFTEVSADWHTWVRAAVGFVFSYVISYAVPAAAVYDTGLVRAVGHSIRALRATFGSDLLAWSALWVVSGVAALLAAVPEAFDLFTSTAGESRLSVAGRIFSFGVILPATVLAQVIVAVFTTVIFFALEHGRAPEGYPVDAVETVSGLRLADATDATD